MSGSVVFRWLVPAALAALLTIPVQTAAASPMGGGHGMGGMGRGGFGGFGGRGTIMRGRPAMSSRFFSSNGMNHFGSRQSFASRSWNFNRFPGNHFERGFFFGHNEREFFFRHNFFVGFNFGAFGWWPGWWWGGPWWWDWDGWAYPDFSCDYGYPYGYTYDDPPPNDAQYGSKEYWSDVAMSVQTKLADDGYYHGQIDGVLGSNSLEAIRQFQSDHGLSVSGKIDPKLLDALGVEYNQQASQLNADADRR
jgi:hypothetical protein